jgi:hypothetical protein
MVTLSSKRDFLARGEYERKQRQTDEEQPQKEYQGTAEVCRPTAHVSKKGQAPDLPDVTQLPGAWT